MDDLGIQNDLLRTGSFVAFGGVISSKRGCASLCPLTGAHERERWRARKSPSSSCHPARTSGGAWGGPLLHGGPQQAMSYGMSPRRSGVCCRQVNRHPDISGGSLPLWQRRSWEHQIRDDGDYARRTDYIHYNPVKHGFVAKVCDWPYSTFHRYVLLGPYPCDWAGSALARTRGGYGEPDG
jgi:hypothetical protein